MVAEALASQPHLGLQCGCLRATKHGVLAEAPDEARAAARPAVAEAVPRPCPVRRPVGDNGEKTVA